MRKPTKKGIALCLLVGGLGALGAAVLPRQDELRPLWDDLAITIQRPLYDEQRRQLLLHLPGFFPLKVTCLFQPKKGEWRTILPGDHVQGLREGGTLNCSNGDKFYLHANTTAQIWARRGNQIFLEVERGWVSGVAAKQPVRLGLGNAEVDIRPRSETRFLATANGRDETYLKCLSGHAQVALSRRVDEPLLLESGACRLDVQRPGENERFTMAAQERGYLADLALPFVARPEIPAVKRAAKIEAEIEGATVNNAISLGIEAGADGKPALTAFSAEDLDDCELLAYHPGREPQELQAYPHLEKNLRTDIPKGARAPLFLECKTGATVRVSNFLPSLKVAVAAPSPAPAAVPVINAPAPASTAAAPVRARVTNATTKARTPKPVLKAPPPKK